MFFKIPVPFQEFSRKKLSQSTQVDCLSNFISNIALIETGKKATKTFSLGIHSVQEKGSAMFRIIT